MRNNSWLRFVALLSVLALVLAACGDGDDATDDTEADTTTTEAMEEEATTTTEAMTETTEAMAEVGGDGVLTIGTLLPVTGDLAFLVLRVRSAFKPHRRLALNT